MKRLIHTPEGVRDIYSEECEKKLYLQGRVQEVFDRFGYRRMDMPALEFFEVFSKELGTVPSKELYKLFDRDGNTLVLRPDFTPSVARAASMYFMEEQMPLRFCYQGNTYINYSSYRGRLRESLQMGVEFLGDNSVDADAEILAMTACAMLQSGLKDFQISVGSVDYFQALLQDAGMPEDVVEELRRRISDKNHFGVEELIEQQKLGKGLERAFLQLPQLFGSAEVLDRALLYTHNRKAVASIERLKEIYGILKAYGYEKYISFDLGMLTQYQYYTGIIFQAYTYGSGEPLAKGGRYDNLCEYFGKKFPAVGFGIQMDQLLLSLDRQKISVPVPQGRTMILYPPAMRSAAIALAGEHRENGMDVACQCVQQGRFLEDYKAYGKRIGFGGIVYLKSMDQVSAINLSTGEVQNIDLRALLGQDS